MLYVKLYANSEPFDSVNDIEEIDCEGYSPIKTTVNKLATDKFVFFLKPECPAYGVYLISIEGDILYHRRFEKPFDIPPDGGNIAVSFNTSMN